MYASKINYKYWYLVGADRGIMGQRCVWKGARVKYGSLTICGLRNLGDWKKGSPDANTM